MNHEYKSVKVEMKGLGIFKPREITGPDSLLNREAREGGRLPDVVLTAGSFGETTGVLAVFERERS